MIRLTSGSILEDRILYQRDYEHAIVVEPGAEEVTIRNVTLTFDLDIQHGFTTPTACGIFAPLVDRLTIENVTIHGAIGCGIQIGDSGPRRMQNLAIRHCFFRGGVMGAYPQGGMHKDILLYGQDFTNVALTENVCLSSNDSGIAIIGNGHPGLLTNAVIASNVCDGHNRHGIVVTYGSMAAVSVRVGYNTCSKNKWAGIYKATNPDEAPWHLERDNLMEHNRCWENGTGLAGDKASDPGKTIRGGIVGNFMRDWVLRENVCGYNGRGGNLTGQYAAGIRVRGERVVIEANNTFVENEGGDINVWQHPNPDNGIIIEKQ